MRVGRQARPLTPHRAAIDRIKPINGPRQFRASGPDQPGEADDLAAAHRQADVVKQTATRDARPAPRGAARAVRSACADKPVPADDRPCRAPAAPRRSPPCDGRPPARRRASTAIRSVSSKISSRRCDTYKIATPCSAQPPQMRKEPLDLRLAQAGRRLVEDQEPRPAGHGAGNPDFLFFGRGQLLDHAVRFDRHSELREPATRLRMQRRPVDAAPRSPRPPLANQQVLRDRQMRKALQLLLDGSHPRSDRIARRSERHGLVHRER